MIFLVLPLLLPALAQPEMTATPTVFGGHVIGETISDWLTRNHMDLTEICGPHNNNDRRMDFKVVCKNLLAANAGSPGTFSTIDQQDRHIDWSFDRGYVAGAFMSEPLLQSTAEEQVSFLTRLYGPPVSVDRIRNSNLTGGIWETIQATWQMMDGAVIIGTESLDTHSALGVLRFFRVTVRSKAETERLQRERMARLNPYGRN